MHRKGLMVGLFAAVAIAGCGQDASREDARDTRAVDKSPPEVIAFNNHFPNVEHKCDGHGHRVFVTTEAGTRPLVVPDPTCPGFTAQTVGPVGDQ